MEWWLNHVGQMAQSVQDYSMILVMKVFIFSKTMIICLLCPLLCGLFFFWKGAKGELSYKAKKTDVGIFHYLHLSLSILCYFLLMNFQWQPIRIMEKCHFLSGIIIQAYRLCFNSFPIQFFYCFIYTLNFKCQVT